MSSPTRTTRTFTISFPPELAEQVELTAKAENRTTSELFREAFRTYQSQRMRRVLRESQQEFQRNNPAGYTESDVARLIKGLRAEKRAKKK
jgi:hypothetical protein